MTELQFPLTWNKCPLCGCPDAVARAFKNEQVAKGKMKEDAVLVIRPPVAVPAIDMREVGHMLSVPVLVSFYDVCLSCGHEYCVMVMKQDRLITVQPSGLPNQGGTQFGRPILGGR